MKTDTERQIDNTLALWFNSKAQRESAKQFILSLLTKEEQPQASKDSGFWGRVASRQKTEIQSLKQANAELVDNLRWLFWNSHIPSGLGSDRNKTIEQLLSKHDKK